VTDLGGRRDSQKQDCSIGIPGMVATALPE
jgi:hypothetical protein